MRYLFTIILLALFGYGYQAYASDSKLFSNSLLEFKYPSEWQIEEDFDEDGFHSIAVEGPKNISVFIYYIPGVEEISIAELVDVSFDYMKQEYKDWTFSNRSLSKTSRVINGVKVKGVREMYDAKKYIIFNRTNISDNFIVSENDYTFALVTETRKKKLVQAYKGFKIVFDSFRIKGRK